MSESEVLERLDLKSRDGQFLWELQSGFELSPSESPLILETVHTSPGYDWSSHVAADLWSMRILSLVIIYFLW